MTVLNLRGSGGSGKTTVYRWLIDNHPHTPLYSPNFRTRNPQKPVAWHLQGDLFLLGRYQTGADGIRFEPLHDLVRAFSERGHVLFENILVSGNLPGVLKLRQEIGGDWTWATLDTPAELCIKRIYQRNGGKPIKEWQQNAQNRRVRRLHETLVREHPEERAVLVDHTRSIEQVHELLVEGGWHCGASH